MDKTAAEARQEQLAQQIRDYQDGNTYQVIDGQTKKVMGNYTDRKVARRRADKLDLAYGAVRYIVKIIWAQAAEVAA